MMGSGTNNVRLLVQRHVGRQINALQNGILSDSKAWAGASLAKLRRAAGKMPGESPDVWGLEFEDLPQELFGRGNEPSRGEWAVHLALTLYAVHQQSQSLPMHVASDFKHHDYRGMGTAVRRLAATGIGEKLESGEMPRRFSAMVTSESIEEASHYARQLIHQLRGAGIPLDYVTFSGQLFDFQNPYTRDRVRLEWAREFSRNPRMTDEE